ncbi:MAG TPA: hypothetical protein VNS59_05630 [Lysobacter sp.]|nr:hypothetical protein [Lysobacter sp.]
MADTLPAVRPPSAGISGTAATNGDSPAIAACTSAYRDAMRTRLELAEASTDARTQLIAAALAQMLYEDPEESAVRSGTALARARELAPEDVLVAWTAAMSCYPDIGCDRGEAVSDLLRLDRDNAAAWLFALSDATLRQDHAAIDKALDAAARAPRYDSHFGDLPLAAMEWMRAVPYPRECKQAAEGLGRHLGLARPAARDDYIAMLAMPMMSVESFLGIVRACKPDDAEASPRRARDCAAVYARMAGSNALITRQLALTMLVQYTSNLPEGAQWRERMRAQQWLMEQMRFRRRPKGWATEQFTQGEVPMLEATLEQEDRWPPPAGWLPHDPRARALVTTGQLPPGTH